MLADAARLRRLHRLEKVRAIARQTAAREAAEAEGTLAQLRALAERTAQMAEGYRAKAGPALAQDLRTVGMDVVQVTHQVRTRAGGTHRHLGKAPLGRAQARHPLPAQTGAKSLKQDVGADGGGLHGDAQRK